MPPLLRQRLSDARGEDSGIVSWITDYKDRTHFVCVESSVLDRQQNSKGVSQETVLLPTAPVKCECGAYDTTYFILESENPKCRIHEVSFFGLCT